MLIYHRPVPAKIPKRRSRAEKKKKCNEERPQCDRCQERGLKCEYEPVKPRKRRRTMSALEQESRPATSVPGQPKGLMRDRIQALRHDSSSGSSILSASPTPPLPALAGEYEWSDSGRSAFSPSSVSSCSDPIQDLDATLPLPPLDPLERFTNEGLGLKASSPHHTNGHTHEDYDEEIPTTRDLLGSAPARTRSAYQDLSLIAPPLHGSPIDFGSPPFMEFSEKPSRRALMGHFCNVLSQLMVFKEDAGNPFRQYLVPMAASSAPILNALLAISSAHLEHRGFQTEERALDLHSASLQGLARIIADNDKSNRDEVLGVIMLLVYYEVIQSGSSIVLNSHLRGALSIMRGRRSKHGPTSAFLEKSFRYFDVICALSFGTSPLSGSIAPSPNDEPFSPHESSAMSAVDTLFGLFGDLWPIIHRLSHLYSLKQKLEKAESPEKAADIRHEIDTSAPTLELALHQWTPKFSASLAPSESPVEDSRLQSILNNAEAYKQAAFVYLFRDIQGLSRHSPKVQTHAKQALQASLRVVIFAGPMSSMLWPLFTAAGEAIEDVDQNVARTVYRHLEGRQGMQNIVNSWDVCEEVWRRGETGEIVNWREVCRERGIEIVLG
ncbi:MAG: hypothetical protein M1836_001771 [Candelina mexicana]|nr:MAG: hypothetical protein M1836_001771 [Candelina mexicana]